MPIAWKPGANIKNTRLLFPEVDAAYIPYDYDSLLNAQITAATSKAKKAKSDGLSYAPLTALMKEFTGIEFKSKIPVGFVDGNYVYADNPASREWRDFMETLPASVDAILKTDPSKVPIFAAEVARIKNHYATLSKDQQAMYKMLEEDKSTDKAGLYGVFVENERYSTAGGSEPFSIGARLEKLDINKSMQEYLGQLKEESISLGKAQMGKNGDMVDIFESIEPFARQAGWDTRIGYNTKTFSGVTKQRVNNGFETYMATPSINQSFDAEVRIKNHSTRAAWEGLDAESKKGKGWITSDQYYSYRNELSGIERQLQAPDINVDIYEGLAKRKQELIGKLGIGTKNSPIIVESESSLKYDERLNRDLLTMDGYNTYYDAFVTSGIKEFTNVNIKDTGYWQSEFIARQNSGKKDKEETPLARPYVGQEVTQENLQYNNWNSHINALSDENIVNGKSDLDYFSEVEGLKNIAFNTLTEDPTTFKTVSVAVERGSGLTSKAKEYLKARKEASPRLYQSAIASMVTLGDIYDKSYGWYNPLKFGEPPRQLAASASRLFPPINGINLGEADLQSLYKLGATLFDEGVPKTPPVDGNKYEHPKNFLKSSLNSTYGKTSSFTNIVFSSRTGTKEDLFDNALKGLPSLQTSYISTGATNLVLQNGIDIAFTGKFQKVGKDGQPTDDFATSLNPTNSSIPMFGSPNYGRMMGEFRKSFVPGTEDYAIVQSLEELNAKGMTRAQLLSLYQNINLPTFISDVTLAGNKRYSIYRDKNMSSSSVVFKDMSTGYAVQRDGIYNSTSLMLNFVKFLYDPQERTR